MGWQGAKPAVSSWLLHPASSRSRDTAEARRAGKQGTSGAFSTHKKSNSTRLQGACHSTTHLTQWKSQRGTPTAHNMNDGGAGLLTHSLSQEAQRNGYLVPLWLVLLTAAPACFSSLQRTTPQHHREQRMPAAK